MINSHRASLCNDMVRHFKQEGGPYMGVEIGVWKGWTSKFLLNRFPQLHLFMVDPYNDEYLGRRGRTSSMEIPREEALDGTEPFRNRRALIQRPSLEVAPIFSDGVFDFVFVDGAHDYDSVVADVNAWWPKVRPGGVMYGHDYDTWRDNHPKHPWGVKKAADEFADQLGLPIEELKGWLFAIRKPLDYAGTDQARATSISAAT